MKKHMMGFDMLPKNPTTIPTLGTDKANPNEEKTSTVTVIACVVLLTSYYGKKHVYTESLAGNITKGVAQNTVTDIAIDAIIIGASPTQ